MNIKNIQEYRTFFKENIRKYRANPERDEHFIGNHYIDKVNQEEKWGWFDIYHGYKEGYGNPVAGIENFLQSFLDMAKDGQAVYEFLQNAVDAGSTHYTMIWGQDPIDNNYYLLVANNGEMFSANSVSSILNVGSSTKSGDSQTIGKFGIGFKLAHRLVGKDNGLQELINENSGPILFSWKNYELENLAHAESLTPLKIDYNSDKYYIEDNNPWLFKILITCFPCLPENDHIVELPIMANGIQATVNPFSQTEYQVLSRWVKNNQNILHRDTYTEGSLFFIKLGTGKESELGETNLKEGVKFALAILKETADVETQHTKILETVQLNNDPPITYPDLEYLKLSIDKEKEADTYAYIRFGVKEYTSLTPEQQRKIDSEANIEALFGFRKHTEIGDYFKGAPNFYLYFPLSEEVHNFNYILHSNAFYKGSSRTFLHKGSTTEEGINERLLRLIADKIDLELNRLCTSEKIEDREQFLNLYAALLTSDVSTNQDRQWIDTPYIKRIDALLKKYIPIRSTTHAAHFTVTDKPNTVFIKKTQIDIDTQNWGLSHVSWFYWGDEAEICIREKAASKLGINDFSIVNLFSANDSINRHLNGWLQGDDAKIKVVLSELAVVEAESIKSPAFKTNLFATQLLRFDNSELLSINEFQDKEQEGYFILRNKLNGIKDLFQKIGINCTVENFDDYNLSKYFGNFIGHSQVKSWAILTKLFSQVVSDKALETLDKDEKHRIFEAFRTLNDTPGERMGELKLFKNRHKKHVCFKNLYANSDKPWLQKFCISDIEDNSSYKAYLLNKPEQVYEGIIEPFWVDIATYMIDNPTQRKAVLEDIFTFYQQSDWKEKANKPLSIKDKIIFQENVIAVQKIFFDTKLSVFSDEEFKDIQTVALQYFGVHIPEQYLLPYLAELPFKFQSATIKTQIADTDISENDLISLLKLSKKCSIDFFASNSIVDTEGGYRMGSTLGKQQISTQKPGLIKYVDTHYPNDYALIPDCFNDYKTNIELSDSRLVTHLIEKFIETDDVIQELDLIEVVLQERDEDKKALLNKLTYLNLDASWANKRSNQLYLSLLKEVVEQELKDKELAVIHNKIKIYKDDKEINIGAIESAQDSVVVLRGDKKIILSQSQILNLADADNLKLIQAFHDEARKRDLLSQVIADKLFKTSNVGITDELVTRFKENLTEMKLVNTHQLLFVLLSGKIDKSEYEVFQLESHDKQWYQLNLQCLIYATENAKYIHHSYLVNERYSDLQFLLQLNDFEAFNYNDNDEKNIIISRFLFVKGCTESLVRSEETVSSKLNYLYEGWGKTPKATKEHKRNEDWKEALGFSPNEYVLNGTHIESEKLPDEVLVWYQNDRNKADFLRDMGVYVDDSLLEKLRQFLVGKIQKLPDSADFTKFNNVLLLNTLNGLAGDFTNCSGSPILYDMTRHQPQLELIEKMVNHYFQAVNPQPIQPNKVAPFPALVYQTALSFKVLTANESASLHKIDEERHELLKNAPNNQLNQLYAAYNIIKQTSSVNEALIGLSSELEFSWTFIPSDNSAEHDEPFYISWCNDSNVRLFREDDIQFDCFVDIEGESVLIGRISEDNFYQEEKEGFQIIYYKRNISLEYLREELSDVLKKQINDLITRKNTFLTSIYDTFNAANTSEVQNSHLDAFKLAIKEEGLKQERTELIKTMQESKRYSYVWFESYLKYLLTLGSKQTAKPPKSIAFQKIKRTVINEEVSSNYFMLHGASALIPMNIEDFDDFKIALVFKNHREQLIEVEGVSKKGQDLLVYCRKPLSPSVIDSFENVMQVRITFTPVMDLLERLYRAFTQENNMDKWEDIKDDLPNLHFIYGPPGTGKTTTLCRTITEGLIENYEAKYLLLTPTNKAADVLCKKLLSAGGTMGIVGEKLSELGVPINITRLGKVTDPEIEQLESEVYQDSLTTNTLDYSHIVASTIHRVPYFTVLDEETGERSKLFELTDHWDYVIFDEASMINLPYLVFAILAIYKSNPDAQFIIAGDPKQIPPVVDATDEELEGMDFDDENVYTMMGINSFERSEQILREGDTIDNLDRQYRSVEQIGQLFSDLSYKNLLKHDRADKKQAARPLPKGFQKFINEPVTFIDFPINEGNSIFNIKRLWYSSYQIYAALFVAELVKYFDSCLEENESWTIGLIAPYKAQAILLNKLITSYNISDKLKIYSDTVHGFQGDECDMVFFICNPNNSRYTGHERCLLSKKYIYNVAISRAKDYLIVLHPFNTISNPRINRIKDSFAQNFEKPVIRQSSDFEKMLFGQKDYIEQNSYVSGHDTVNVFGKSEMTYFIKANESAIDIQLGKEV